MAAILYPAWLPPALHDGYGFRPVSPIVRSTFVSGRSMQRRRAKSTPTQVAVNWLLNDGTAALFEKWFQEDLSDGAAHFLCLLKTSLGMGYYRAQFVDIYEGPELVGGKYWRFSATVEVDKRPLLADGSTAYPDAILHSDIVDLAANREWPEA